MPRKARQVVVNTPHHVIQRGNRRQNVFIKNKDKQTYLNILSLNAKLFGLQVWAYCLMDNHVHLIVVPEKQESMTKTIATTHQIYTRMINFRESWHGYLWEGRYKSKVLDEKHVCAAIRYIERNPVRAGMVNKAQEYKWSSAAAHVYNLKKKILTNFYLLDEISDWQEYLKAEDDDQIKKLMKMPRWQK